MLDLRRFAGFRRARPSISSTRAYLQLISASMIFFDAGFDAHEECFRCVHLIKRARLALRALDAHMACAQRAPIRSISSITSITSVASIASITSIASYPRVLPVDRDLAPSQDRRTVRAPRRAGVDATPLLTGAPGVRRRLGDRRMRTSDSLRSFSGASTRRSPPEMRLSTGRSPLPSLLTSKQFSDEEMMMMIIEFFVVVFPPWGAVSRFSIVWIDHSAPFLVVYHPHAKDGVFGRQKLTFL